jgi:voltage-gated potassium channel
MKFMSAQISYFLSQREARQNIKALLKYAIFVLAVIAVFSAGFHLIMLSVEGRYHSWITGIYWTLTVMTTLGFGDITFHSDIGRLFSIVVLLSGIVLLLIVLPFMFIRLFYAPWLEAQVRARAPRQAPESATGHVVICTYDTIAPALIERLRLHDIPYYVIEPDPAAAARMHGDGISVVTGEIDSRETYERLRASRARLLLANSSDTINTNMTLTVREAAPNVPILGIVDNEDSIDILELSGCTHVLPLKRLLGERLAIRINTGHAQAHVIGSFRGLLVAEFPVHNTPLAGRTIGDTNLQEAVGVKIVAVWERGRLLPASPETYLSNTSVPVVVGTPEQMLELDTLLVIYDTNYNPVLVIGGGKVGCATARALREKGVSVHLVERDERLRERIADVPDGLFIGDAADREVLMRAGLERAPSVILTTNDDATNIYLAVYCRRLNPELRIVSRITHQRNIEAIHRAGADAVLSYASLGVEYTFSLLHGHELVLLGGGIELFAVPLPLSLAGSTLAESGIDARTGLNVVGIQENGRLLTNLFGSTPLPAGSELIMLGSTQQLQAFTKIFGATA